MARRARRAAATKLRRPFGYAVDALGAFDVHGKTSTLTNDEVTALIRYVEAIESRTLRRPARQRRRLPIESLTG